MAKEDKAEETPVKEQPKDDQPDIEGFLAELEKAGVSNVKELEGKLEASKQVGNMANELGRTRAEIQDLKATIASSQQPQETPTYGSEDVDLNAMIGRNLEKALDARDKRQAENYQKAQKTNAAIWSQIENDPRYPVIKDIWEQKRDSRDFQWKLQQGLVNPYVEFTDTIIDYYQGIARRSVDTIKTLTGHGTIDPPHVEGGEARVAGAGISTEEEKSEAQKTIDDLKEKGKKRPLSEAEELDAIQAMLKK